MRSLRNFVTVARDYYVFFRKAEYPNDRIYSARKALQQAWRYPRW